MSLESPKRITEAFARWNEPVLAEIARVLPPGHEGSGSVADMAWYHLATGGKRLRPLFALLATEALGGDPRTALPFAAGCELLHNATLVHDDYQDGDTMRRSQPTVWRHYGWEQSINCGDALYFAGLRLVAETAVPHETARELVRTTSKRLLEVIEGQTEEFNLKRRFHQGNNLREAEYVRVIRGKTAALFALPLEGAALIAGHGVAAAATLGQAGETLGLLFQVQDDLLDLIGEKGRHIVGSDLAEGKPSLPVVFGLEMATERDQRHLEAIVKSPREHTSTAEITEAISILERSGAMARAFDAVTAWRKELVSGTPALDSLLAELVDAILLPIAHRL